MYFEKTTRMYVILGCAQLLVTLNALRGKLKGRRIRNCDVATYRTGLRLFNSSAAMPRENMCIYAKRGETLVARRRVNIKRDVRVRRIIYEAAI